MKQEVVATYTGTEKEVRMALYDAFIVPYAANAETLSPKFNKFQLPSLGLIMPDRCSIDKLHDILISFIDMCDAEILEDTLQGGAFKIRIRRAKNQQLLAAPTQPRVISETIMCRPGRFQLETVVDITIPEEKVNYNNIKRK